MDNFSTARDFLGVMSEPLLYRSVRQYEPEDKRDKNVWVNVRAWWGRSVTNTEGSWQAGRASGSREGWFTLQFWLASKWRGLQGMCEFGLPFQSLNSLGIIHPFPSSFVGFVPVEVEPYDIHLIKMYCRRRCGYCDHISSDGTSYARFFQGLTRGSSLQLHIWRFPAAFR